MRYLKYFLALLLLAALVAGVALHLKRESIARGIANDVLAGSGFRVVDLAIARLRADEIRFSRLVLEQDDGARYEFRDLHVPLSLPATTIRSASIGRLAVRPAPAGADAPAYAVQLDAAFALADRFPGLSVSVEELVRPGWPPLDDVRWRTEPGAQHLALVLAGLPVQVSTTATGDGQRVRIEGGAGSAKPALRGELDVVRATPGYRAEGTLTFDLEPWLEYAGAVGLAAIDAIDARAAGSASVAAEIETGGDAGAVTLSVRATLDGGAGFDYGAGDTRVRVSALSTIDVGLELPSADWTVRTGAFDADVSYPLAGRIKASVASLDCGPDDCRFSGTVRAQRVAVDTLTIGKLEVDGAGTLSLAGDGRWSVAPARLNASDVREAGWQVDALGIREPKGFVVGFADGRLGARADRMTINVEGARTGDAVSANARLHLDAPVISVQPLTIETRFDLPKEGLQVAWRGTPVVPARLRGRAEYDGAAGEAEISVADPDRELAATLDVRLLPDRLEATIGEATVDFGAAPLSASFDEWPHAWNLVGGTVRATGTVEWIAGDAGGVAADVRVTLEDGAAAWEDLGATGVQAVVPVNMAAGGKPKIGPADVRAALVDVGLPLEDVRAGLAWDMSTPDLRVDGLSMGLLGGTLEAERFEFNVADLRGSLRLSVDGVQLGLIPELANFDAVELTGALSGTIPVRIDGGTVTVEAGHLENEPPGGVIRYRTQTPPTSGSGLALAQRALSNLQYKSLSSDVTYTKEGDLVMKLRLEGTNPDLDPLQPVILNLTVENNIPQLLKSLQATRDIQDVIESRTRKNPGKLPQ